MQKIKDKKVFRRLFYFFLVAIFLIAGGAFLFSFLHKKEAVSYGKEKASSQRVLYLRTRTFSLSQEEDLIDTEKDGRYGILPMKILVSRMALLVMDPWAYHPNDGLQARIEKNMRRKLAPLIEALRKCGVLVIYCPHGMPIHPLVVPKPGDIVLNDMNTERQQLINILKERGITCLLYAGYSSNMCILNRPVGLLDMKSQVYIRVFVRDASLAIETPTTVSSGEVHDSTVFTIELNLWAVTTTVDEVLSAVKESLMGEPQNIPLEMH